MTIWSAETVLRMCRRGSYVTVTYAVIDGKARAKYLIEPEGERAATGTIEQMIEEGDLIPQDDGLIVGFTQTYKART